MELYVDDARILRYDVTDQDDVTFTPDSATITVYRTSDNDVKIEEIAAGVTSNQVFFLINTTNLSDAAEEYYAIWKLIKATEIFRFRTNIVVWAHDH